MMRRGNFASSTDEWFRLKLSNEVGELTQAFLVRAGQARGKGNSDVMPDRGFRSELADAVARVLLLARWIDVDSVAEIEQKGSSGSPTARSAVAHIGRCAGAVRFTARRASKRPSPGAP